MNRRRLGRRLRGRKCLFAFRPAFHFGKAPQFFEQGEIGGKLLGGGNMTAMHLAKAVGRDLFLGFLAAVTFATILAVVSGLALAGASAVSHDLYAGVLRRGDASEESEMRVTRIATLVIGAIAVVLGILFKPPLSTPRTKHEPHRHHDH